MPEECLPMQEDEGFLRQSVPRRDNLGPFGIIGTARYTKAMILGDEKELKAIRVAANKWLRAEYFKRSN